MKPDTTIPTEWIIEHLTGLSEIVKEIGSSDDDAECILPQIISSIAHLQATILDPKSGATTQGQVQITSIDRTVSIFHISIPARAHAAMCEFNLGGAPLEVPVSLSTPPSSSFLFTQLTIYRDCPDEDQLLQRLLHHVGAPRGGSPAHGSTRGPT